MFEILFDEYKDEPVARIRLTEGKFCDTIFHINYISVENVEEEGIISFDYDVDEGVIPDELAEEFEQAVGDVVVKIIMEQADKHGNGE